MKDLLLTALFTMVCYCTYAQRGFNTWQYLQQTESHLQATHYQKNVYESLSGKRQDLYLKQQTTYQKGYLKSDVAFDRKTGKKLFDIQMSYTDSSEVISTNLLDSSQAIYYLTAAQKVRYYVSKNNSQQHIIYTYNDANQIIKCKDCLQPLGNHDWCVYYQYVYNTDENLAAVYNYNLAVNTPVSEKILIQKDTFIYNEQQLMSRRESYNPAQNLLTTTIYDYNKKQKLIKEVSSQSKLYQSPRSYTKAYAYHCNGQLRKKEELYYKENTLSGRVVNWYNKKGEKTKSKTYNQANELTRLLVIKYK